MLKLAAIVVVACSWLSSGCATASRLGAPEAEAAVAWDAEGGAMEPGFSGGEMRGLADHSGNAQAEPTAGPQEAFAEAPKDARQVIYTANISLVVVSPAAAQASVAQMAQAVGGWMSESDARSVTVRVPAAQFEPLLERIATLGEVVDRSVRASDVTEQLIELDIRLDNARRARERLLVHLEKSEKMEDTLRIEAELARVTTEIESIEGKLRYLRSQVAMSTIRVDTNRAQPSRRGDNGLGLPFDWVGRLGDGLVAGSVESRPRKPGVFASGPRFEPPAEFIRYYSDRDTVEAMNADGVRIKLRREANYDKGALSFWTKLARQSLVRTRSLAVHTERDLGDDRALVAGTREVAGIENEYLLVIARTKDDVYTFEAWGPKASFASLSLALEQSALSLRR